MALPEFQRGYVWNSDQVRKLFTSLYLRRPVGGLLVWATESRPGRVGRGAGSELSLWGAPGQVGVDLEKRTGGRGIGPAEGRTASGSTLVDGLPS